MRDFFTPKITPEMIESAKCYAKNKRKQQQKQWRKSWLVDHAIETLALIVAIIALFRMS